MSDARVQSVLRCGQCNKPFNKESTLKRHGYYCRSRRAGGTAARLRSCISCARGKTGCDNRRPACSRCISKAIECHYPTASTPVARVLETQHRRDASNEPRGLTALSSITSPHIIDSHQQTSNDTALVFDAPVTPDLEFTNIGGDDVDWENIDIAIANFSNMQPNDTYHTPGSLSFPRHLTPSGHQTARELERFSSPGSSIPRAPNQGIRTLVQRPKTEPGAQRIASLIRHTLKSYSLMMLRHDALPPFIHPNSMCFDVENIHMEPLTNCISLVRMISSGIRGSRKLFWKNVGLECERWSEDHRKLSKWGLLAAMQALSIYVLIRLDEGETDYDAIDFPLVKAVILVAQQLARSDTTCNLQCATCNSGLETSWREWIYRESRRRLAIVYRVVNMLIYFEPSAMCDLPTDFILAPLPAKRQLWEAGDQLAWKAESQKGPTIQISFALAADGEIVKLDEGRLSCSDAWLSYQSSDTNMTSSKDNKGWEEWCSGMDGFGGLVMLAASLVA